MPSSGIDATSIYGNPADPKPTKQLAEYTICQALDILNRVVEMQRYEVFCGKYPHYLILNGSKSKPPHGGLPREVGRCVDDPVKNTEHSAEQPTTSPSAPAGKPNRPGKKDNQVEVDDDDDDEEEEEGEEEEEEEEEEEHVDEEDEEDRKEPPRGTTSRRGMGRNVASPEATVLAKKRQ
eukprot:gene28363-35147_t